MSEGNGLYPNHAAGAIVSAGLTVATGVAALHSLSNGHGQRHLIRGLGELFGAGALGATTAEHIGKAIGAIRTDGYAYTRY